ncbi:MAG: GGDEF domain-containing protein [Myxococcota bacterium]
MLLFSKVGRNKNGFNEKSLTVYLLELSLLIAQSRLPEAANLVAQITGSDAVLLKLSPEIFSTSLSEVDQSFLRGEVKPKVGQLNKLNSLLETDLMNLGRLEVGAYAENDVLIAGKIERHLSEDLARRARYEEAIKDAQTGFFGRELFFDFLEHEFNRSLRYQAPMSLILMDIDGFSKVSNADLVLSKTAMRIRAETRQGDFIARLSEKTFALIEPITTIQNASEAASRILAKFKHLPVLIQETPLQIHLSIGVASLSPQDESPVALIEKADVALQAAKRLGGNQIVVFD